MSLLLDALNRASKDKAAATATPTAPVKPDNDWPAISLLPQVAEPVVAVVELAPPAPQEITFSSPGIVEAPEFEARLSLEPDTAAKDPVVETPQVTAPAVNVEPPAPDRTVFGEAAPAQPEKVAQTMVRAKSSKPPSRRPLLLALGGLAGLLAAGLASVFLGLVDPLALIAPRSSLGVGTQMAVITMPPASAPVQAPATVAAAPAEPAAKPVTEPAQIAVNPSVTNRPVPKPKPVAKVGAIATAEATMSGAPAKTAGPAVDCGKVGLSVDCPPPVRQAAKPRAKVAAPKPAEPLPSVLAKVLGPSQLELAYAALTQGRVTDAAAAYNRALADNPEERDALLGLAYIAHQTAREEEARDLYKRVLRQEPGNPSARAGLLTQTLGNNSEDVSASSREVAEQNPGSAAAQSVLGHSLVRQGRLADAQQAFQRAQVLEPGVALHAFNLAVAFDRLRSYGQARAYYEQALALSGRSGGEALSGVPHAVVQLRLQDLLAAGINATQVSR